MVRPEYETQLHRSVKELEKKLDFTFCKEHHLITALTRRSYRLENPSIDRDDNERLEFLGDGVLKMIISDYLYNKTDYSEAEMTRRRIEIEKNETLAKIAERIGIMEHILMGEGEKKNSEQNNSKILANTFEAIIGAMYIDSGFEKTKDFFRNKMMWTLVDLKLV